MAALPQRILQINERGYYRPCDNLDAPALTKLVEVTFSKRDVEIMRRLSEGFNCKQIGQQVGVSISRFKQIMVGLRNRAGVFTNSELVAWALRNKVIE